MQRRKRLLLGFTLSASALGLLAIPALGQDSPESLLPPGFGDNAPAPAPAPPPPPPPAASAPSPAATPAAPSGPAPSAAPSPSSSASSSNDSGSARPRPSIDDLLAQGDDIDLNELEEIFQPRYALSESERRSMASIGLLDPETGGLGADAFGGSGGQYLTSLIYAADGPLVSRWASILLRRTLLSRLESPANINPADWAAARAWRLLRMGEAEAARALSLEVDVGNYTPWLHEVAMQAHLATGDVAGLCPLVPSGNEQLDVPTWKMFRPICASLSGEQSRATQLLRQARRDKTATGIDYLLAEKLIGVGFEGRRAVRIDWSEIQHFNNWRFGLGIATGVEPPSNLLNQGGRHVQAWRARAPMLSIADRIGAADVAAGMGILSNDAMVDLYSFARNQEDVSDDLLARISLLRDAYVGAEAPARIAAMQALWERSNSPLIQHSMYVLTASAAARIAPGENSIEHADRLIAAMLTAGLDRSAQRWGDLVDQGSLAWGLIAVSDPQDEAVDYSALDDFKDEDASAERRASGFFLAVIAGLNRASDEDVAEFADDLEIDLTRATRWSEAISTAAERGQQGTVALLAAVGLQGPDWTAVSPFQLYHVISALNRVGLNAEARMIGAEAIARISL